MSMHEGDADRLVRRAVAELMEHFTAVRIFVSAHDTQTQETHSLSRGGGCYFSQRGQIMEWMEERNEEARDSVRTHLGDTE